MADGKVFSRIEDEEPMNNNNVEIIPISHATAILNWNNKVLYIDPIGEARAFEGRPQPDIILVTDIHGDHFSAETLEAVSQKNTVLIVPATVAAELSSSLAGKAIVLNNDETAIQNGFSIEAIPMYNLPESKDSFHPKGRGNGYVIDSDGKRIYVAGDTEDIPEMRNLKDIDVALIPMNLPFTMTIESAADAVLEFQPKQVYPYHYRGKDGLSDIVKFKELVNAGNSDIEVIQLNWYPEP